VTLLAHRVAPPFLAIAAVFGLTLVSTQPPSFARPVDHVIAWPGAGKPHAEMVNPARYQFIDDLSGARDFADARPWHEGGMVMGVATNNDPLAHATSSHHALTDLLSGLFAMLRGLAS